MKQYTYDAPLMVQVELADVQAVVTAAGKSAFCKSVRVLDVVGLVGATPADVVISLGDGTTADLYGTISLVGATATAGDSAAFVVELTDAASKLYDVEKIVVTNTTVPAASLAGVKLVLGYF